MSSLFENFKPRASQIGYLMTNLPEQITKEEEQLLAELLEEKLTGKNANGRTTKWIDTKQKEVDKLNKKKKGEDELPTGAISKLEEIFNDVFWKRKKILNNKYLEKGIIVEEDCLQLLSDIDLDNYWKNEEFFENSYVQGSPDNVYDKIRDTKANYDFDTFQRAELTSLYAWQIKSYTWLAIESGYEISKTGELCYCLVNSPGHRINTEIKSIWFSMGCPEEQENGDNEDYEKFVRAASQLERNHIFDIQKFKDDNPGFDLYNKVWEFDIPKHMRVKRFEVTLEDEDIKHIIRRSKMCKNWLIEKEKEELLKINNYESRE
jgi:hypothetical protein